MKVSEYGSVRFFGVTDFPALAAITGRPLERWTNAEEGIVYMARVSSPRDDLAKLDSPEKLLRFLVRNGHWSPFDMVDLALEIETSRAIMAQVLRHWSARFQEFSQRYSEVNALSYEHLEIRRKADGGNRQGSGEEDGWLTKHAQEECDKVAKVYQGMLDAGAAPESARMILPLATLTKAFMKGSVRTWMTYFWQRLDGHAQKEHRCLAALMFREFAREFPVCAKLVLSGRPRYCEGEWADQVTLAEVGFPLEDRLP